MLFTVWERLLLALKLTMVQAKKQDKQYFNSTLCFHAGYFFHSFLKMIMCILFCKSFNKDHRWGTENCILSISLYCTQIQASMIRSGNMEGKKRGIWIQHYELYRSYQCNCLTINWLVSTYIYLHTYVSCPSIYTQLSLQCH